MDVSFYSLKSTFSRLRNLFVGSSGREPLDLTHNGDLHE